MVVRLSTAIGNATGSSGSSSFNISSVATFQQAQMLIVYIQTTTTTVTTVTQTNCIWTKAVGYNSTSLGGDTEIWYCLSTGASPGATVAVNISVGGQAGGVLAIYDTAMTALDQVASNGAAASSALSSGTTPSTTQAAELWVAGFTTPDHTSVGFGYSAPTNGFSIVLQNDFSNLALGLTHYGYLDKIVAASGAAASGVTSSGAVPYSAAIATFKFNTTSPSTFLTLLGCGN